MNQAADPDDASEADQSAAAAAATAKVRDFSFKPREIRDYLDRFVIGQAEAKKVLSVAICDHYNHVRRCLDDDQRPDRYYAKQNVLMMGPTGVGKTYLMRCIARLIGVPFVKADATKFSETGYVGYDVEDIVRDLVRVAGEDADLAQYGIIYIDEVDKIAASPSGGGKDVSGRGVQVNLLKLMEETEVNLLSQTDLLGQMQAMMAMQRGREKPRAINTRHMLFIVSGAFDKLGELVRSRLDRAPIGFASDGAGAPGEAHAYLARAEAQDFVRYGFEPEFIGRLPVRLACEPLSVDDLERILLKSEESILEQYRDDFRGYEIDFEITPQAIRAVAERAVREKTGARGLLTVLERVFRDYKFELPSTHIRSFEVSEDIVRQPAAALNELRALDEEAHRQILHADLNAFVRRFDTEHAVELTIEPAAAEQLVKRCLELDRTMRGLCEELFRDFEYGLKLVATRQGAARFVVTEETLSDPAGALSRWVAEALRSATPDA
ncbi:MAG: AAA family ATPase [Candidatus Marinimicrobia bacterium]|nr:AAA family ATPase [Candidatus Neomarinimicrobiota bacterium]